MMFSKNDIGIIALVPEDWGGNWQVRHHLLTRLAAYFPVVWVNPTHERSQMLNRLRKREPSIVRPATFPGFTVYRSQWWLPKLYRPERLARLTLRLRLTRAQRLLAAQGCNRTVLYLWRPEFAPALVVGRWHLVCYHIDDEYSFSEVEAPLNDQELQLIRRADQVIVHSPALFERKGHLSPRTAMMPNGVDYAAYSRLAPDPDDLAPIPHPRIGYTGTIKRQLNWDLLLTLVARHPEWSFVFVGPVNPHPDIDVAIKEMARRPNVHFLGFKTVEKLSAYPQHFDTCIMPYLANDYTKYIYPLKLHEYLASGTPVVGTRIRSLEDFAHLVELASTPEEWSRAIAATLAPAAISPERRFARQEVARRNDWGTLVGSLARMIAQRLDQESPHTDRPPAIDPSALVAR